MLSDRPNAALSKFPRNLSPFGGEVVNWRPARDNGCCPICPDRILRDRSYDENESPSETARNQVFGQPYAREADSLFDGGRR
jgi:hypothetical protein